MADSLCGTEDGCRVSVCVSVGVPECAIDTKRAVQRRWGIRPVFFFFLARVTHAHSLARARLRRCERSDTC